MMLGSSQRCVSCLRPFVPSHSCVRCDAFTLRKATVALRKAARKEARLHFIGGVEKPPIGAVLIAVALTLGRAHAATLPDPNKFDPRSTTLACDFSGCPPAYKTQPKLNPNPPQSPTALPSPSAGVPAPVRPQPYVRRPWPEVDGPEAYAPPEQPWAYAPPDPVCASAPYRLYRSFAEVAMMHARCDQ
jgi:hypothetical protein